MQKKYCSSSITLCIVTLRLDDSVQKRREQALIQGFELSHTCVSMLLSWPMWLELIGTPRSPLWYGHIGWPIHARGRLRWHLQCVVVMQRAGPDLTPLHWWHSLCDCWLYIHLEMCVNQIVLSADKVGLHCKYPSCWRNKIHCDINSYDPVICPCYCYCFC